MARFIEDRSAIDKKKEKEEKKTQPSSSVSKSQVKDIAQSVVKDTASGVKESANITAQSVRTQRQEQSGSGASSSGSTSRGQSYSSRSTSRQDASSSPGARASTRVSGGQYGRAGTNARESASKPFQENVKYAGRERAAKAKADREAREKNLDRNLPSSRMQSRSATRSGSNFKTRAEREADLEERRRQKSGYNNMASEEAQKVGNRIIGNMPKRIGLAEGKIAASTAGSFLDISDMLSGAEGPGNGKSRDDLVSTAQQRKAQREGVASARNDLFAKRDEFEAKKQRLTKGAKGFEKAYYGAEESLQGMLNDFVVGAATGGAWEVPLALRVYGESRGKAQQLGATETEDRLNAAKDALIEVATEHLGGAFGAVGKLTKGKKAFTPLTELLERQLAKQLEGKAIRNAAVGAFRWGSDVIGENVEEFIANPLQNAGENLIYKNRLQAQREADTDANLDSIGNDIRSRYMSDPASRDAFIAHLNSKTYRDEMFAEYKAAGMNDRQANEVTSRMLDFMTAAATGDTKRMKDIRESLDPILTGEIRNKVWDWNENLESLASTSLMTGVTGLPGAVTTTARGQAILDSANSHEKIMNALRKTIAFDKDNSGSAQAMLDDMEKGYTPSATQAYSIMANESKVINDGTKAQFASEQVKNKRVKQENLLAPPAVWTPEGRYEIVGEKTAERYMDSLNDTLEYIDIFNRGRREDGQFKEEDARRVATAAAKFNVGTFTVQEAYDLSQGDKADRHVFEQMTGTNLNQYNVYDKKGNLDVTATNIKMRDGLLALSADNYVQSARIEQENWNDTARGRMHDQFTQGLGVEGDKAMSYALEDVDPRDQRTFMATAFASNKVYEDALYSDDEWHGNTEAKYRRMFPSVNTAVLKSVYEAGRKDKAESETPYLNARVKRDEKMSAIASGSAKAVIKGKFFNETPYDPETDTGRDLKANEQIVFEELAGNFNANVTMVDAQDERLLHAVDADGRQSYGNAKVDLRTGEIYISNAADVGKIVHEFTHLGAVLAPEQFLEMSNYVIDKAYKANPEATKALIQSYKNTYKGKGLNDAQIREEVVADLVTDFIKDERFARDIAMEEPGFFQQLYNAICDILRALRNILATGRITDEAVRDSILDEIDAYEQTRQMWVRMMREAAKYNATIGMETLQEQIYEEGRETRDSLDTSDANYMAAVERGDMRKAQSMVEDAAIASIPNIAKNPKYKTGRVPLKLYHGTPSFGFTQFKDSNYEVPFIYTSTDNTVSAHYAGDHNYASPRQIGKPYREGNSTEDIIENAKTVWDTDLRKMSTEEKKARYNEVKEEASKVADKIDELYPGYWSADEATDNAIAWVEDLFFTVRDGDYFYNFDEDDGQRETANEILSDSIDRFKKYIGKVKEYRDEHYKELDDNVKALLNYLCGYDVGDAAIDIEYGMQRVATEEDRLVNVGGSVSIPSDLKTALDKSRNIGAYTLYGDLGENPLEFDADGAQFWAVKVPQIGDEYMSTDQICKWAYENGYTSVIMHNIYDYGDKADNYVFFDSSQLKSADPVTYDDNGDVIPLSERFNSESADIRYSVSDIMSEKDISDDLRGRFDEYKEDKENLRIAAEAVADLQRVRVEERFSLSERGRDLDGSSGAVGRNADRGSRTLSSRQYRTVAKGITSDLVNDVSALNDVGVDLTESGSAVRFSLYSWEDTDIDALKAKLRTAGFDGKRINKWIRDVNSIAALISKDKERLNYTADQFQDALKPNAEYYYTLDLSTLCQKRRLYQGTYNKIMKHLVNNVLMPEDTVRLRAMMDEMGYQVPCGICYEESRKKNEGKFAERWLNGYGKKWKGYKNQEHTDPYIPTLYEVTTTEGREKLREEHPEAYESYVNYQKTRGSANPKISYTHTDYRGDILRMTENDIAKVKHIGGLRIQSFSDFEIPHVIDMMQAVMDMSAMNLTAQAYTKVPAFAEIFGGTGIKINLSLIGRWNEETQQLEFDAKEGIDPEQAFKLRDKYSKNVGTILVGSDDTSILKAWADPRVDMVIPFHRSGWSKKEFDKLGLVGYKDYTKGQTERYMMGKKDMALSTASKALGLTKEEKLQPIYSADYWDNNLSGKENAERYLALCAEKHYRPVFYQFLHDNGDGTWSLQEDGSTDGYWKSLIDFKMYDNDGVFAPQEEVQPVFDMDAANRFLRDYEGGADTLPVADDVVTEFLKEYKQNHPKAEFKIEDDSDVKFSLAMDLDEPYMQAVNSGNMEEAQRLVDKAAKIAGMRVAHRYHGSMNANFTVFDKAYAKVGGNSGAGFYFSTSEDDSADHYANVEGADNYFKWSELAEYIHNAVSEGTWEGYPELGITADDIETYEDAVEAAKKYLNKSPGTYDVYLNYKNPYIRDYKNSTNIYDMLMDDFDESVIDRDDYEDEWEYEDAVWEAKAEHLADSLYSAVYGAYQDIEDNYEVIDMPYIDEVLSKITEYAFDGSLTWEEIQSGIVFAGEVEVTNPNWTDSGDATPEFARAIIENLGFDAIEDKEVSSKFGQLSREMQTDTEHIIVFKPEQIKLSDPVTYAEDGSVIPLSERFDPTNNDIRYSLPTQDADGNILTNGQMEYFKNSQARNEEGRLVPVYHTTEKGGFTIFDPMRSDDHRSLFFASSFDVSQTYGYNATDAIDLENAGFKSWDSFASYAEETFKDYPGWDASKSLSENLKAEITPNKDNAMPIHSFDEWLRLSEKNKNYHVELKIPTQTGSEYYMFANSQEELLRDISEVFGKKFNQKGYYSCYLNLENPMIIDADGQAWDSIAMAGTSPVKANQSFYVNTAESLLKQAAEKDDLYGIGQSLEDGSKLRAEAEEAGDLIQINLRGKGKIYVEADADSIAEALNDYFKQDESADIGYYVADDILSHVENDGKWRKYYSTEYLRGLAGVETHDTRGWAEIAEAEGYDGAIFRNLVDVGDKAPLLGSELSDIYIAFSSNQVKDTRNENPTEDPDIRWSFPEDEANSKIDYNYATSDSYEMLEMYEEMLSDQDFLTEFVNATDEQVNMDYFMKMLEKYGKADKKARKTGKAVHIKLDNTEEAMDAFYSSLVPETHMVYDDVLLEEGRMRMAASKQDFWNNLNTKWNDRWVSGGEVLEIKSVKKDVRNLVMGIMDKAVTDKKYDEDLVNKTLVDMRFAYQLMKQGRSELASALLYHSALRMIENTKFIEDDTAFREYRELRDYLRNTRISFSERYWSDIHFNEYRKRNRGRIKLVKGENNIDKGIYSELERQWPQYFGEQAMADNDLYTKDVPAMMEQLDYVLNLRVDPVTYVYSSEDCANWAFDIANDLYDIMEKGDRIVSTADRYKEKYEAKARAMKVRQAEALLRIRKARDEGIAKEKARFKEYREDQKEKKLHSKYFDSIAENHKILRERLLTNTKDKHIPEQYKKALARLLAAFDLQTTGSKKVEARRGVPGKKTIKMQALKTALNNIEAKSSLFHVNDSITDIIERLLGRDGNGEYKEYLSVEGKALDELTSAELKDINDLLKALVHEFNNYETVRVGIKRQQAADIGSEQIKTCSEHVDNHGQKRDWNNFLGSMDKILNLDEVTPAYMFRMIDRNNTGIGLMFKELRRSFNRYVQNQKQINKWMDKILGEYHNKGKLWNKYGSDKIAEWRHAKSAMEIPLESGRTISLTPAQMMSIYCLSNRQQAVSHMKGAGIVVQPVTYNARIDTDLRRIAQNSLEPAQLTDTDILNIKSNLTPEQIKVATDLQQLMATKMAEWGNEASMAVIGIRLFEDPDYFPIKSDKAALEKDFSADQFAEAIRSFGFTKAVQPKASNSIAVDDIFDVVAEHCNQMNLYNAYSEAMNDFMKVYNYHEVEPTETGYRDVSVEQAIANAFSKKATTYIGTFMKDLNGNVGRDRTTGVESLMNDLLASAKKASVFANGRVALQQPTAIMRAFAVIDPKYLKGVSVTNATMREMFEHSSIALWKSWGYYDINMGKSIEDLIMNEGKWSEDMMTDLYGKLDNRTWTAIWGMCKAEIEDKHKDVKVGSDEYWELVGERMDEVVDLTQVVDSPFHRSHAMRSKNTLVKMFTSFMAEPTLTFNMVRDGLIRAREESQLGNKGKAGKILGRTMTVFLLSGATTAAAAAIWDVVRGKNPDPDDDDEDKTKWQLWLDNFLENLKDNINILNNIYYVKDVLSIFQGWDQKNLGLQGFKHLADAKKQFFGGKSYSKLSWWENTLAGVGYLTGIPFKTIESDVKALWRMTGLDTPMPVAMIVDQLDSMTLSDMNSGESSTAGAKAKSSGTKKDSGAKKSDKVAPSTPAKFWTYENAPFHVEDGSLADNFLNHFGINLTSAEIAAIEKAEAEAEHQKQIDKIKDSLKDYTGSEYDKHLWDKGIMEGYGKAIEDGDFDKANEIEHLFIECGGSQSFIDDKKLYHYNKNYVKTIVYNPTSAQIEQQTQMKNFLLSHGVTEQELSERVYKSQTAKELKVAFRIGDEDAMVEELVPLVRAGLSEEDYNRLWENRNRLDIKKYKESGGKYADRLKSTGTYNWPITGTITSRFGHRSSPGGVGSTYHQGLDIAGSMGDPVNASDGGTVIYTGWYGGAGKTVKIQHDDGTITQYSHLSWWDCKPGDIVAQGQYIGKVGSTGNSTGPHLHFGVIKDGNYVDPSQYLQG